MGPKQVLPKFTKRAFSLSSVLMEPLHFLLRWSRSALALQIQVNIQYLSLSWKFPSPLFLHHTFCRTLTGGLQNVCTALSKTCLFRVLSTNMAWAVQLSARSAPILSNFFKLVWCLLFKRTNPTTSSAWSQLSVLQKAQRPLCSA